MITQNGQPSGQTPLRTPVRDKLNINQPEDMDPAMFENFEQVRYYIQESVEGDMDLVSRNPKFVACRQQRRSTVPLFSASWKV